MEFNKKIGAILTMLSALFAVSFFTSIFLHRPSLENIIIITITISSFSIWFYKSIKSLNGLSMKNILAISNVKARPQKSDFLLSIMATLINIILLIYSFYELYNYIAMLIESPRLFILPLILVYLSWVLLTILLIKIFSTLFMNQL